MHPLVVHVQTTMTMNEPHHPSEQAPVKKTRPQSTRRQLQMKTMIMKRPNLRRRVLTETDKKEDGNADTDNTDTTSDDTDTSSSTTDYDFSSTAPSVGEDIRTIRGIGFPYCRYGQLWHQLTLEQQTTAEQVLDYDELSFNFPHSNAAEEVKWSSQEWTEEERDLLQSQFPCLNQRTWDLFINHYYDYFWMDLEQLGVAKYYQTLGWDADLWDYGESTDDNGNTITDPWSDDTFWHELTPLQQNAARQVGWFPEIWNSVDPMQMWDALPQPQIVTGNTDKDTPTNQNPGGGFAPANNSDDKNDANILWAIILVVVGVMMLVCFGLYYLAKRVFPKKHQATDDNDNHDHVHDEVEGNSSTDPEEDSNNNTKDDKENESSMVEDTFDLEQQALAPPSTDDTIPATTTATTTSNEESVAVAVADDNDSDDNESPLTDIPLDGTAQKEEIMADGPSKQDADPPTSKSVKLGPLAAMRRFWSSKKKDVENTANMDTENDQPQVSYSAHESEPADHVQNDDPVEEEVSDSVVPEVFAEEPMDESVPPPLATALSADDSVLSRDPPGEAQPVPETQMVENNPIFVEDEEDSLVVLDDKTDNSTNAPAATVTKSATPASLMVAQNSDVKTAFKHKKEIEDYETQDDVLQVGSPVWIKRRGQPLAQGEVQYYGSVHFEPGDNWVGIRLTGASAGRGRNNGTVLGKSYFTCPPNCGLFVKRNFVTLRTTAPARKPAKTAKEETSEAVVSDTQSVASEISQSRYFDSTPADTEVGAKTKEEADLGERNVPVVKVQPAEDDNEDDVKVDSKSEEEELKEENGEMTETVNEDAPVKARTSEEQPPAVEAVEETTVVQNTVPAKEGERAEAVVDTPVEALSNVDKEEAEEKEQPAMPVAKEVDSKVDSSSHDDVSSTNQDENAVNGAVASVSTVIQPSADATTPLGEASQSVSGEVAVEDLSSSDAPSTVV